MHNHPLTCRGCGEYAELPGGCECPEAEPEMAELEHLPASMSMTGAGFHALELRTRDRERKLLKKIEQSIARIDAGDYGYCDETGEPIGLGRLID